MTRVVGLDLSLTSTGIATASIGPDAIKVTTARIRSPHTGIERLSDLRRRILAATLDGGDPRLVLIEGYAFAAGGHGKGSTPSHAHALGELGGVIRLTLFERGYVHVDVPPSSLKLYATGKGNASKDMVFSEAIRRLGYEGSSKDEADALFLLAMGLDWMGRPLLQMPDRNRTALTKITWPEGLQGERHS